MTTAAIETTDVQRAMDAAGAGRYRHYANDVANFLRGGPQVTAERVMQYARQRGVSVNYQQAQTFVNTLLGSRTEAEVGSATPNAPHGFDRTAAANIIREAGRTAGVNMSNLEEVLVEAGLVDNSEPDEEAPAWARGIMDRLNRLEGVARSRGLI